MFGIVLSTFGLFKIVDKKHANLLIVESFSIFLLSVEYFFLLILT